MDRCLSTFYKLLQMSIPDLITDGPTAANMSSPSTTTTTTTPTVFIPQDIIESHLLKKLDAPTLATFACVSTRFQSLSLDETLWQNICQSTWPHPRVADFVAAFPSGCRSFFATALSTLPFDQHTPHRPYFYRSHDTRDLISAVDIVYNNKVVYSTVHVTDTWADEFRSWPTRIAVLENAPDAIPVTVTVDDNESVAEAGEKLRLSWIVMDPIRNEVVNLSSMKPVLVKKNWITRDQVVMRYSTLIANTHRRDIAEFRITVTCSGGGGGGGGKLVVKDVNLQVVDGYGIGLFGRDGLEIIQEAMERGRRKLSNGGGGGGGGNGCKIYNNYLKMRREKKVKEDLDRLGLGIIGILLFLVFFVGTLFWVPFYSFRVFVLKRPY